MSGDYEPEEAYQARIFQEALMEILSITQPPPPDEEDHARIFQEALKMAASDNSSGEENVTNQQQLQYLTASNLVSNSSSNPPSMSLLDLIRNSSAEDQSAAFSELLRLHCTNVEVHKEEMPGQQHQYNNGMVSFPASNGKRIGFYLFPSCVNASENGGEEHNTGIHERHGSKPYFSMQRTYKRKMQPQQFESFLISCFGTIEAGVSIFMDSCSSVGNGAQFRQYLSDKKGLRRKYTKEQCLSLKSFVQLTGRQYERLSQTLQTFDGSKYPAFVNRRQLKEYENKELAGAVPFMHKIGSVREYATAQVRTGDNFKLISFHYSVKDCVEVVKYMFNKLRAAKTAYLGIWMGESLQRCIIPYFIFDHGGDSFKAVMTLIFYEGCKTVSTDVVGLGSFKETTEIVSQYLMPDINSDSLRLGQHYVVTVEWHSFEFDYVLLHRDIFGVEYNNSTLSLPDHIAASYDSDSSVWWLIWPEGEICFDRLDIPADGVEFKVIPIIPHRGGDYKEQFLDTGRAGHSSSKAMKSALLQAMWQDNQRAGTPITLALIAREVEEYREVW